jgi:murein DD-endopeptidase MepM/ murein hydrolase activator NlpD
MHRESSAGGALLRLLLVLALLVIGGLVAATFWLGPAPRVDLKPSAKGIGHKTSVLVHVSDVGRVERLRVELVQGGDTHPILDKPYTPRSAFAFWRHEEPVDLTAEVGRDAVIGLRSGDAIVRLTADRAGSLLRRPEPVVAELKLPVRLAPPALSVVSGFHYVAQGGCEAVVYHVSDSSVRDGVQSGSWWFPGYALPGGPAGTKFALFAVPYDTSSAANVHLVAMDDVDNKAEVSFVDMFFPKPLKYDTIVLNDAFLNRVVTEIMAQTPEVKDRGSALANYLEINGDLRRAEGKQIQQLAEHSAHQFLWKEAFMPLRNAKITAAFAQRRTYTYQGKKVDEQDHLGFDMASVEHDSIPASNSGTVVLARFFGIYGNAVVIDHGYGLMTLYGHLSSIAVREGQAVNRGQEVGRSGQTGLAGGDHLHFTTVLDGLPVNPVEWWDPHWIADRLARKLGPVLGGTFPVEANHPTAQPAAAKAPAHSHAKARRKPHG